MTIYQMPLSRHGTLTLMLVLACIRRRGVKQRVNVMNFTNLAKSKPTASQSPPLSARVSALSGVTLNAAPAYPKMN